MCGIKVKNMEDDEGQYKETIGELEKKIKFDSYNGSRNNSEKGFDSQK